MQPVASGHETELMYKEIFFRSVSKPGRVTAPGFVVGAVGWGLCIGSGPDEDAPSPEGNGEHMVANRHDLPVQPKGEKFPVNFLLFTESPDSALP
jgi:hypothetical protein